LVVITGHARLSLYSDLGVFFFLFEVLEARVLVGGYYRACSPMPKAGGCDCTSFSNNI
jgi:hypothetical protein